MSSSSAAAPYTWDDFVALEEDDLCELIDGELVEVEVPTWRHEDIVILLGYFLTAWGRVTKLRWYAQLGVPEYWVVDPEARTLERLVLRDGAYVIAASLAEDETFTPESFEGLSIPHMRLWG
jgi:Uma2 family endonuclease